MSNRAELDWVARLRAAGYHVTAATRDELPPPAHTLPPKRTAALRGFRRSLRRLVPRSRNAGVPHAVP
ncbi:MAG TPA: hypothetical protein VF771_21775 [Longimicrobiaceae bacterium]